MTQAEEQPEYDAKTRALAAHLKVEPSEVTEERGELYECETERGEWRVLTDSEADQAFKESLESYIEDMMRDWPETAKSYFDEERFIRDVELGDGRGPTLSGYDGAEHEEQIDGEWYFIYRAG